jgi:GDP-D-mannose 3',5'-epimerase
MEKHLILGASGFLGSALERRLKELGHYVVSISRNPPKYRKTVADEFNFLDLSNGPDFHHHFFRHHFDCAWQLAGSVGGLGYIGTGEHDADILTNSLKINLHTLETIRKTQACDKIFFASSQCVYPDRLEVDPFMNERVADVLGKAVPQLGAFRESDASFNTFAFGQEKLYAEKLYDAYARNYGIEVRIGRIGNTYGPYSTWDGDRAKAVAALCRKVAQAPYAGVVELWGDAKQSRSFTYVDDTIDGIIRLMSSGYSGPVNIASSETVTIEQLFGVICETANKILAWKAIDGPVGVRHRGSDNTLCREVLGWEPKTALWHGIALTYPWIRDQALTKAEA